MREHRHAQRDLPTLRQRRNRATVVNDRFRACDEAGRVFEVSLQAPMWSCPACRMCWEGQEALAAKESAYLAALTKRAVETRSS